MTHAEYQPRTVAGWLRALHGNSQGWIYIGSSANTDTGTRWKGGRAFTVDDLDQAAAYVADLDSMGASGIYLRLTSMGRPPAPGERGGAADSASLPALAADIDLAGPGHKHDPAKHDGRTLPPDEAAARAIIAASGLPEPTLWQRTGGGMYPWWLLDKPVDLWTPGDRDDREVAGDVVRIDGADHVNRHLGAAIAQAAHRFGWDYGTGVHDLSRVLRIPGTINRKDGLARQSTLVRGDTPPHRYNWRELADLVLAVQLEQPATTAPAPPQRDPVAAARPGMSPLDAFEAAATIADVLEPAGWTYVRQEGPAQLWRRPGGTSEYSAKWGVGGAPVLVVHSDHAGLPAGAGQRLTLARVAAHLHYGGDTRQLTRALLDYAGGNPGATLPNIGNLPAIADYIRAACNVTPYGTSTAAPPATRDELLALAGGSSSSTSSTSSTGDSSSSSTSSTSSSSTSSTSSSSKPPADDKTPLAEFSDARLAETLAARVFAGRYLWTAGLGWFAWTGTHWREADLVEAIEAVRKFVLDWAAREIRTGAAAAGTDRVKALLGLLSGGRINAITALSRGLIVRDAADMDADPDILNTPSGVVDLRTGQLLPHDPAFLCTKVTSVAYDPGADDPDWKQALESLRPDAADWFQLRMGQALTGHIPPDDALLVCQGGGENGKTTVFSTLMAVAGSYARLVSDRVLLANPDAHPTELMDLRGVRLALIEETPEARKLDVARLKKTVGTPEITARHIRKDSVTFRASHSLVVNTNYRPLVTETDHGTWRRLRLVTFPYRYVKRPEDIAGPDDRLGDPTLRERLRLHTDSPAQRAVLAWLVEGAARWYRAGRVMPAAPASVEQDTRTWRTESDQILAYIEERIRFDPASHVMATELLADFNAWLADHSQRPWGDKILASRFGDHEDIRSQRVTKSRIRHRDGLVRSPHIQRGWVAADMLSGVTVEVPRQYVAWLGLAFATDDEQGEEQPK